MARIHVFEAVVRPMVFASGVGRVTVCTSDMTGHRYQLKAGNRSQLVSAEFRPELSQVLATAVSFVLRVPINGVDCVYGFVWHPGNKKPTRLSRETNRHCQVHDSLGEYLGDEEGVSYR